MNRQELLADIKARANKENITDAEWTSYLDTAGRRINRRFPNAGITVLRVPTDSNPVTVNHPELYIYATLKECYMRIRERQDANDMEVFYREEVRLMNITYSGDDWVAPTRYVKSETQMLMGS